MMCKHSTGSGTKEDKTLKRKTALKRFQGLSTDVFLGFTKGTCCEFKEQSKLYLNIFID